jgi:ketosteroid isomerase-like protein
MYHTIVKKLALRSFEHLNQGNYEAVLKNVSPTLVHTFSGQHALGGTRHSKDAMREWFKRLFRLSPGLHFQIRHVAVSGMPWNTVVAVEWIDRATPADGSAYVNEGVHIIKMRWGKVVYLHAYLDTQRTIDMCERLATYGMPAALAAPIED